MSRLEEHMRIAVLAERLAAEHVGWTMSQAVEMATLVVKRGAEIARVELAEFERDVLSWIDALPVTEERP